ncbi:hypothetical protein F5884DRAFT_286235 [Xylogone sp. PMI_703]|nr:hypothetical protein F5884DRAFT_286235 [Xylogone sp. PMI_703]
MKKNVKSGKSQGKASGKKNTSQPVSRGSKGVQGSNYPISKPVGDQDGRSIKSDHTIPIELQQLLLNIFQNVFSDTLSSTALNETLQEIKSALFDRDFARAFGKEGYLDAYSARWSPSRALCYASILVQLRQHLEPLFQSSLGDSIAGIADDGNNAPSSSTLNVVCIGGGAAETVACGGLLSALRYSSSSTAVGVKSGSSIVEAMSDLEISRPLSAHQNANLAVTLVDVAQWGPVVQRLQEGLITPPPLSKYASATAKGSNSALIHSGQLNTRFYTEDVLGLTEAELQDLVGQRPTLLTLLFTLNELYTASIGKTTRLLLDITTCMKSGSLLLVVDSPGSYSETSVGHELKKYPMKWLMDHTLLETLSQESNPMWDKVISEDSLWFRLAEQLRYPIPLENMRYQMHLYRRS